MPTHYGMKKEKTPLKKGMSTLSELFNEHKKHHTKKHLQLMKDFISLMPKGIKPEEKFKKSHNLAKKYIIK